MKLTIEKNQVMSLALALVAAYAMMLVPADAFAAISGSGATPTALSNILCNVVSWFTGPLGGAIATLAIIVIGVGALMGKVSWGMAIIVGLGIGVIFGAPQIVKAMGAGESCPS